MLKAAMAAKQPVAKHRTETRGKPAPETHGYGPLDARGH